MLREEETWTAWCGKPPFFAHPLLCSFHGQHCTDRIPENGKCNTAFVFDFRFPSSFAAAAVLHTYTSLPSLPKINVTLSPLAVPTKHQYWSGFGVGRMTASSWSYDMQRTT